MMQVTNREKIQELRDCIYKELAPLFQGHDSVLLDAPYYENIGDLCIWQGESDFLSKIGATPLFTKSLYWQPGPHIDNSVVIALQGGGNFGDIYRVCQDFRLKVIQSYPENRIVMFPQSVWYDDLSLMHRDASIMARHKDLWLCARDMKSYDILKTHFSANNVLLVPDMAFCISDEFLNDFRSENIMHKKLFMRRRDGELTQSTPQNIRDDYEVKDWPTFNNLDVEYYVFHQCNRGIRFLSIMSRSLAYSYEKLIDRVAISYLRPRLVKKGFRFLSQYDEIVTTRLHALIIGILLGKRIFFMDNKTGKLSDYYNSWLLGLSSVRPY